MDSFSAPVSPRKSDLDTSSLSLKAIPSSTYEYDSGFSQQSFLCKDFNVTSFINKCSAKITQMVDDDFNKTLDLIGDNDDDMKKETETETEDNNNEFPAKHLTASNLKQLHNDVTECYENLKQELIESFEANYPQFLALNESLTAGTERNLKECQDSLDNIHKKYNTAYQQILRLLERIHSKSALKSNYISKLNTLKQISFVANTMQDVKISLQTLHADFNPFTDNNNKNDTIDTFKQLFGDEISHAAARKQYRLLQKSSRLERIAILLTKLSAIFAQKEVNQHLLVKNAQSQFVALRNRFYNELKELFLCSIRSGSLLSLRSNLRCYNYLNIVSAEEIVREHYLRALIYSCLPITIFTKSNTDLATDHKKNVETHFDKLYTLLVDKLSILFNREILSQNDFIADAIWCQLIDILLNDDYAERFISRGLPNMFHAHYCAIMRFLRRLQALYYKEMTCLKSLKWQIDSDKYLWHHSSTIALRKKCNLSQYFLFRMPLITKNVMQIGADSYASIEYHFKIYLMYYQQMKGIRIQDDDDNDNQEELNQYIKRLNDVKDALSELKTVKNDNLSLSHYGYNYALPIFQVVIIHLLQCWDVERIWIYELSSDFLKLSLQICSFLSRYLTREMQRDRVLSAKLIVLIHSDLYYFCEWMKYEYVALIEERCGHNMCDAIATKIQMLIAASVKQCIESFECLRNQLLETMMCDAIVAACDAPLVAVDELADSWQANVNLAINIADDDASSEQISMNMHKVSDYVSKLFKALQEFLMFINDHALEHLSVQNKSKLIWNVLNAICAKYWNKIENVQKRLAQIQKIMERRRFRRKNKAKNKTSEKSGAERAEYQLFIDVRQFRQQIQGFVNGLQRDETQMKMEIEKKKKEEKSSSIIVIKKKKKTNEQNTVYDINKLQNWHDFTKFVDKLEFPFELFK